MATFRIDDLDVDPKEYVFNCSSDEIRILVDVLVDYGYVSKSFKILNPDSRTGIGERIFEGILGNLHGKWNLISREDEETIRKISESV